MTSRCIAVILAGAAALQAEDDTITFQKQVLTDRYYCDGITHGDINRDGNPDIVAGPFWYEGPDFLKGHAVYEPIAHPPALSPSDSMFSYVHDFDGDGWLDILRLGRVHKHEARWFRNPGDAANPSGFWESHLVADRVKGESPPFIDVDGDGAPELVTHWETHWGLLKPVPGSPEKPWQRHPISEKGKWEQFYHGTGVGDINDDGRLDIVLNEGWYEQPARPRAKWRKHPQSFGGEEGGAQIGVFDVDGDGDADVVSALHAHGWGLSWFEQRSGDDFHRHVIMGSRTEEEKFGVAFSEPHALEFADMNGDGLKDIVVGKRRWAHGPEGDVEPGADPVVYWFELKRDEKGGARFIPHLVDDASGVGVQIAVADVNGDGKADILTASKLGAFVFRQMSQTP